MLISRDFYLCIKWNNFPLNFDNHQSFFRTEGSLKNFILLLIISSFIFISKSSVSQITFTDIAPANGLNDPGNGQGATFIDFDNDGYLDIFLDNNGNQNKLWKNNGGTSFTDVTAQYGLAFNGPGRGCSSADFNNDGLPDIMVGNYNQTLILYKNTGSSFINFTTDAGLNFTGWGGSINWIDYNNDGKIDAMYANDGVPYHYNYLFKNNDLSTFTNVAYTSGLVDSTSTLCIASADYDNDGDMDIFCGTQTNYGPATNFLYRNNGNGTFTDVTVASGLVTYSYTWGADWGDFNNDGYMDLYVGNSNAPNQLFKNNGNGTFTEVGSQFGVADPSQT
jgi:hypothetical protein